ncbi:hypothetical protein [Zavarzinella formosa]|uniref:hypothetical protein n=1 Tax=Zavarzinella formosa TaxID=360055 RepID=UPI0012FC6C6E|nr:hypothetical protein [Zavarzinella formosa]
MSDTTDFGERLGFTPAWHAFGVADAAFLERARAEWDKGEDNNPEHYRYRAFCEFLAAKQPLSPELAIALYELGATDADQGMGGAMMAVIVRQPECPEEVLAMAATSGRPHLIRAVERRAEEAYLAQSRKEEKS